MVLMLRRPILAILSDVWWSRATSEKPEKAAALSLEAVEKAAPGPTVPPVNAPAVLSQSVRVRAPLPNSRLIK